MYQRKVSWNGALSAYRVLLFGKGAQAKGNPAKGQGMIDAERAREVIANGGKPSWAEYLRMRVGYFSRGEVLGSSKFVREFKAFQGDDPAARARRSSLTKSPSGAVYSLRDLQ